MYEPSKRPLHITLPFRFCVNPFVRLPIPHTWQVLDHWYFLSAVLSVAPRQEGQQSQPEATIPNRTENTDGQQNNAIKGRTKKRVYSISSLLKSCSGNSPVVNQATDFQFKPTVLDIWSISEDTQPLQEQTAWHEYNSWYTIGALKIRIQCDAVFSATKCSGCYGCYGVLVCKCQWSVRLVANVAKFAPSIDLQNLWICKTSLISAISTINGSPRSPRHDQFWISVLDCKAPRLLGGETVL